MKRAFGDCWLCVCRRYWFWPEGNSRVVKDVSRVRAENISDPFAAGWMLVDTNGDGIADAIVGKIVVPDHSSAAENAAAANFAARVGYGSTGLTLPIVITASEDLNQRMQRREYGLTRLIRMRWASRFIRWPARLKKDRAEFLFPAEILRWWAAMMQAWKRRRMLIRRVRRISGKCREINFRRFRMR